MVLVARDATRLQAKAEELEKRYGIRAEVLAADLADDGGVAAVVARLKDPARPVEILVNNAGIGLLRSFAENDIAEETKHLKLHVETAMQLSHAALQGMLARQSGRIINVASVAAFLPRGTYSAAKAWLLSFSRSANMAYAARGVKVTAVCPGFTHTEFHDRMGMDKTVTPRWMWLDARAGGQRGPGRQCQGQSRLDPQQALQSPDIGFARTAVAACRRPAAARQVGFRARPRQPLSTLKVRSMRGAAA